MCPRPCTTAAIRKWHTHHLPPLQLQVESVAEKQPGLHHDVNDQSLVVIFLHVPMIAAILYMND
jgi:hypothetical protein